VNIATFRRSQRLGKEVGGVGLRACPTAYKLRTLPYLTSPPLALPIIFVALGGPQCGDLIDQLRMFGTGAGDRCEGVISVKCRRSINQKLFRYQFTIIRLVGAVKNYFSIRSIYN